MAIILRSEKNDNLTFAELDNNLIELESLLLSAGIKGPTGPKGNTGDTGCIVSNELPINPDLAPLAKIWVQVDIDLKKILNIFTWENGNWIIPIPPG